MVDGWGIEPHPRPYLDKVFIRHRAHHELPIHVYYYILCFIICQALS